MPTGRYTDIIGRLRPNAIDPGDIVDLTAASCASTRASFISLSVNARGLGIASGAPLMS